MVVVKLICVASCCVCNDLTLLWTHFTTTYQTIEPLERWNGIASCFPFLCALAFYFIWLNVCDTLLSFHILSVFLTLCRWNTHFCDLCGNLDMLRFIIKRLPARNHMRMAEEIACFLFVIPAKVILSHSKTSILYVIGWSEKHSLSMLCSGCLMSAAAIYHTAWFLHYQQASWSWGVIFCDPITVSPDNCARYWLQTQTICIFTISNMRIWPRAFYHGQCDWLTTIPRFYWPNHKENCVYFIVWCDRKSTPFIRAF